MLYGVDFMANNKMVVANLKMNMMVEDVASYLHQIASIDNQNVIICPTALYIPYFLNNNYHVGLQDIFFDSNLICTGEISANQASRIGITHALIGHSDRRIYFQESEQMIQKKLVECLKFGIAPILCVGETAEERGMMRTERVIKRQITSALRGIDKKDLIHVIIAYEPVWAIGSNSNGNTPSNKEIEDMAQYINGLIFQLYQVRIPILYGGNVDDKNVSSILENTSVSGVVVGGVALDPKRFLKVLNVIFAE